jgi:hypothetical protein
MLTLFAAVWCATVAVTMFASFVPHDFEGYTTGVEDSEADYDLTEVASIYNARTLLMEVC